MEMREMMIREVHPNVYTVKETNLWHDGNDLFDCFMNSM